MTASAPAPLFATADAHLREELLRLAAAAGVVPDLAADAAAALRGWARAPVVVVGADLVPELVRLRPARRDGVYVLAPGAPPGELFQLALGVGAESVTALPGSEAWVVDTLTDLGEAGRPQGLVVGVVGGSGGAGATTLACALGQVAAARAPAVVVDCDALGPGVDRVLGVEGLDGSRWEGLCQTTGRLSARALREALPRRGDLGALSWTAGSTASLQPFAVREAVAAARRGHDTVVLDLPRSADAVVDELVARCDLLLMVVVPTLAGVASAARLGARHRGHADLGLVLRGHGVEEREVERATRLPVAVTMPDQRGLAESIDLGLGPVRSVRGPLGRTCITLLDGARAVRPAAA